MSFIEIKDLNLIYQSKEGNVHALKDINLNLEQGEFISFIGPSGCGKTTLLRVIADLEQPTKGNVLIDNLSPNQTRLQRKYGYIFQSPALYPWRTVEKNIHLPLEIFGIPKSERHRRTKKYLDLVHLTGFEKKYPWQLSGGMQQRVSIARALSFDAKLLLMDEPFGALDEITREHLNEQLLQIWKDTGKTIIFVTHSIPEAIFLSSRIVIFSPRPGRIVEVVDSSFAKQDSEEIRVSSEFIERSNQVRSILNKASQ